jgi:hypothetical protein
MPKKKTIDLKLNKPYENMDEEPKGQNDKKKG